MLAHHRWMKGLNINIASEQKQRVMATEIVGDNLVAEKGAFTFPIEKGGEEIHEAPFVYCRSLIAAVADTIEKHNRQILCTNKNTHTHTNCHTRIIQ